MMERVALDGDLDTAIVPRDDSVDTQDSMPGAAADTGLPTTPAAGDIALPSTVPRRAEDSRPGSSSAGSKPATEASTLPIRGVRSPPGSVHQLLATGPADSVRDTAGKPVCNKLGNCSIQSQKVSRT